METLTKLKLYSRSNMYTMRIAFSGRHEDLKNINEDVWLDKNEAYYITKKDITFKNFEELRLRFNQEEYVQLYEECGFKFSTKYDRFVNIFNLRIFYSILFHKGANYLLLYSYGEQKDGTFNLYIEGYWKISASKLGH